MTEIYVHFWYLTTSKHLCYKYNKMNNMKATDLNDLLTNIFISIMLVTVLVGYDIAHTPKVEAHEQVVVPSPIPTAKPATVSQNTIIEDTPENYIKEVFGEHYPKAMLLLKGQGAGTCAENRTLDQKAYNRNWVKGKPGVFWSTDWGIFQINDKYHPVEKLNLRTDWKANIDYAYRMFKNDNYRFVRWACGKFYGI